MTHALFDTVAAMLDPAALRGYGTAPVTSVRCVPFQSGEANSGSSFYYVETNDSLGPRYLLKRVPAAEDVARSASAGVHNRSVALWQHGLLDRLPAAIVPAIVACAYDGAGYAILMQDMSDVLLPGDHPFTLTDHTQFLDAMAAMHAAFLGDRRLSEPSLGLQHPSYLFTSAASGVEGWAFLETFLEPVSAQVVRTLLRNPQPLYTALLRFPATLVHNDLWWANLGIVPGAQPRVVVLDWDFATCAPPAVDLAFYIGENTGLLPVSNEAVIDQYRSGLAGQLGTRFDEHWWQPQVDLSLLGCFLRRGKWRLLTASRAADEQSTSVAADLAWWSDRIVRGAQWL